MIFLHIYLWGMLGYFILNLIISIIGSCIGYRIDRKPDLFRIISLLLFWPINTAIFILKLPTIILNGGNE